MAYKRTKRKLVRQLANYIHQTHGISKVSAKGIILYEEEELDYWMKYDRRYRRQFHISSLAEMIMENDEGKYQLHKLAYTMQKDEK